MTEFETASLALSEAALFVAIAHVVVALLVSLGQIGVVYVLQDMDVRHAEEAEKRDRAEKRRLKADIRRHTEAMQAGELRHTEAMTALHELIRRTTVPQGT